MQDQQVGDAFVLGERQPKGRLGVGGVVRVTVGVAVDSVDAVRMAVDSVRDVVAYGAKHVGVLSPFSFQKRFAIRSQTLNTRIISQRAFGSLQCSYTYLQ